MLAADTLVTWGPFDNDDVKRALSQKRGGSFDIVRDARGKPCFVCDGAPSPVGLSFSDSADLRLIGIAEDAPIGIDLEILKPVPDGSDIIARQMCPMEYEWFLGQTDPHAFLRLWTLKEAFIKALGDGLARSLCSFTIIPGRWPDATLHAVDGDGAVGTLWTLKSIIPIEGTIGAVAVKNDQSRVMFRQKLR